MNLILKNSKNLFFFAFTMLFMWSCSEDNPTDDAIFDEDQKIEASEVNLIMNTDTFSSTVDTYLVSAFQSNQTGKASTQKVDCAITDVTNTGYTVIFDNCTVDGSDEVLNGTLSVVFEQGNEDSAFTATYSNVSVGDVVLNGTRSFVISGDEATIVFDVVSDMTLTMADGSVLSEAGAKKLTISFTTTEILDLAVTIEGDWTVTNNDEVYEVSITTPLRTSFSCENISSGVMTILKDGLVSTVTFGNGDCDAVATITYPDGSTAEFNLTD